MQNYLDFEKELALLDGRVNELRSINSPLNDENLKNKEIEQIHKNSIYLIPFVHLPQLLIQICVFLFVDGTLTFVTLLALLMTVLDVLYETIARFMWRYMHQVIIENSESP